MNDQHVTVLGGGFAGLAAAQRVRELDGSATVFEKKNFLGGHAHSMARDGFTFDEGPHVSFTKIPEVKELLAKSIDHQHHEFASVVQNYFQGHWVKHPAQVNLHGLPPDLITRCVMDFLKVAADPPSQKPDCYADWLLAQYGETFAREFPFRYTRKYWAAEPEEMTTSWIGPRMYQPNIQEVIRGAVGAVEENKHYIKNFRYPEQSGFGAYTNALMSDAEYHMEYSVERIDPKNRTIEFQNGDRHQYERLISSLPLPELIPRIEGVPRNVLDAVDRLVCTSLAVVDVGVRRDAGFPDGHWLYFYDEDICFARANYPHLLARSNAPAGCGSIQVEVYYTKHRPLPYQDVLNRAIEDMGRVGMLKPDDDIILSQVRHVKYGNVMYNNERDRNLAVVESYLDDLGIVRCGRYGLWNYHWTDQSITSGWDAAAMALGKYEKQVQA